VNCWSCLTTGRPNKGSPWPGLDPREHQSGSSVNKKPRLSKAGNRYLRIAFYMPALSATSHDPNVRAYYHYLIAIRGLKALQALCAVMRKLLLAIHAGKNNKGCRAGAHPDRLTRPIPAPVPDPVPGIRVSSDEGSG